MMGVVTTKTLKLVSRVLGYPISQAIRIPMKPTAEPKKPPTASQTNIIFAMGSETNSSVIA